MVKPSLSDARFAKSMTTPLIAGFEWLPPQDEIDQWIYREILTDGCAIIPVQSSPTSPEFTYSVGLYLNFLAPEILILGVHPDTGRELIRKIRDEAISGRILSVASVRNDLFDDHRPVRFVTVPNDLYLEYMGRSCSFYLSLFLLPTASLTHDFPVLQAIWPDQNGIFPDEAGCDPRLVELLRLTPQFD